MGSGARDLTDMVSQVAAEFAAEAAYQSRMGTAARLAAEAADEDAFAVAVPAVQVFGPEFRDHVCGSRRRPGVDPRPMFETITFAYDTELVVRYLRRSPGDEWRILACVPRDHGTACRRVLTEEDGVSGRLKAALFTYAFAGDVAGIEALGRSLGRGALRWFGAEFEAAHAEGMCTPRWWGRLLYPGGLADDEVDTVATDVGRIRSALARVPVG